MSDMSELMKQQAVFNELVMAALVKSGALSKDVLEKAPAAGLTAQSFHGSAGLLGDGIEPDVLSTVVRPRGYAATLPAFPSIYESPTYAYIVGVSDDVGAEAVNVCDDAPTGTYTVGTRRQPFGRVTRDTNTIEIGQVNLRRHRGDMSDLRLAGQVLGMEGVGLLRPSDIDEGDFLNIITKAEMVNAATRLERKMNQHTWDGDPLNNTANGGYKEFIGLNSLIATGTIDAEDGVTPLPSLDSLVIDAAFTSLTAYDIVGQMESAEAYVFELGEDTLGGITADVVMHPVFWQILSQVWPIKYNTQNLSLLAGADAGRVFLDGRQNIMDRDSMRTGKIIVLNGRPYNVITDNTIHLVDNTEDVINVPAGSYASSIYFSPRSIGAGLPVTYFEYVDFRMAFNTDVGFLNGREDFWTDAGQFYWGLDQNVWCYKLKARTEKRLVFRTPQVAFRIDNLLATPLHLFRSPLPSEPGYVAGGRAVAA